MSKEALKLALEALEYHTAQTRTIEQTNEAITAIKEALAQPEQEPVAWTLTEELTKRETTTRAHLWFTNPQNSSWTPLYTTPPQRKPLTDEQYFEIGQRHWLPSVKVEQIHKELEEAARNTKE
jgi:hypothetical protein